MSLTRPRPLFSCGADRHWEPGSTSRAQQVPTEHLTRTLRKQDTNKYEAKAQVWGDAESRVPVLEAAGLRLALIYRRVRKLEARASQPPRGHVEL